MTRPVFENVRSRFEPMTFIQIPHLSEREVDALLIQSPKLVSGELWICGLYITRLSIIGSDKWQLYAGYKLTDKKYHDHHEAFRNMVNANPSAFTCILFNEFTLT